MDARLRQGQAFSLIEIIIALSILGVGLIGAMRVFPVGLKASQRAELRSRAVFMAQKTLETLKTANWDSLSDGVSRQTEGPFTLVTSIRLVQPEHVIEASTLKQVDVAVEWVQDGKPQQMVFATYIRRPSA